MDWHVVLMDWNINIVTISIHSKVIYRFNTVPIRIPAEGFVVVVVVVDLNGLALIYMEGQRN